MIEAGSSCIAGPTFSDRCLSYADALCQWSVVLLAFLPFTIPHHYQPYSTFFQESVAFLLGLFAFVPVAIGAWRGQFSLPRSVVLPLVLIAVICLQLLFLDIPVWQDLIVFALYLVWGALLMCVGCYLAAKPDLGRQTLRLSAWSFLFGAVFNAFVVWAQILGVAAGIPFVFSTGNFDLVGNLAQTNLLATYLALGICALIYLEAIEDFPTLMSWPILLALVGTGFWVGSRMFVLELLAGALLAFLPKRDRALPLWRRLRVSVALAFMFYAAWFFAKVSGLTEVLLSVQFDRTARVIGLESSGAWVRLGLWKAATEMVWQHPWLGIGVNNFDWVSFDQMKLFPSMEKAGTAALGDAEHAHNIVLHLAAEMGLGVGLMMVVWLVMWVSRSFKRQDSGEDWWLVAVGSVILVHSMLEYPLWYAYYLALFCFVVGWRSTSWSMPQKIARPVGIATGVSCFLGLGLLVFTASQYLAFERMVNMGPIFGGEASVIRRSAERLMSNLENASLMSGKAIYGRAFNFSLNRYQVHEKAQTCRRAIRWEPDRAIIFRCAVLFALEGRRDEALVIIDRGVLAFPAEALTVSVQLSELVRELPELRPFASDLDAQIARRRQQYPLIWNPGLMPSSTPIL